MSTTLEQLHYTWAVRGIEGSNRFQIAASSPGLQSGPLTRQLAALRRLCQYEPPRGSGQKPVSFGWLDHGGLRVAFWRVGLETLRGKQGNFSAHLLVGRPEAMLEHELALRFDSPFWWRGGGLADPNRTVDRSSFVLPTVTLADIREPEGFEVPPSADRIAGALLGLRRGERIAVQTESWELGRCLRAIAVTIPEALDGITASTYETRPVVPFRVLGSRSAPSTYRVLTEAAPRDEEVATLRHLRHSPRAAVALRDLHAGGVADPDKRRAVFWSRAQCLAAAASGAVTEPRGLAAAIARPACAAYVIGEEPGRGRVAEALVVGSKEVAAAVASHGHGVAKKHLADLALLVAAGYRTSDPRGCARSVSALIQAGAPGTREITDVALSRISTEPTSADELDDQDVVLLIAEGSRTGGDKFSTSHRQLVQRGIEVLPQLAAHPAITDFFLRPLLPSWLESSCATSPGLLQILRARPLLPSTSAGSRDAPGAGLELSRKHKERCTELLAALRGDELAETLTALLPILSDGSQKSAVNALLRQLPLEVASRCLINQSMTNLDRDSISALCAEYSAAWLGRYLRQAADDRIASGRPQRPAADQALWMAVSLIRTSGSSDLQLATRLLRSMRSEIWPDPVTALAGSARLGHKRLAENIALVALDHALRQATTRGRLTMIWNELSQRLRQGPAQRLETLLLAALRIRGAAVIEPMLGWIAIDLLPAVEEIGLRRGRLCDQRIQRLCVDIARHADTDRLKVHGRDLEREDHAVRSWWTGLVAESRTPSGRRRRLIHSA